MNTYSVIWATVDHYGTPHKEEFAKFNPDVPQFTCSRPRSYGPEMIRAWRNCDASLRQWWRENGHQIKTSHVAVVEWDVLIREDINKIFSGKPGIEIAGKTKHPMLHPWQWFEEANRIPGGILGGGCLMGMVPFCLFGISVECFNKMDNGFYDPVFDDDIFCELRFPTIAMHSGFQVWPSAYDCSNIGIEPREFPKETETGIFHPIKI